MSHSRIFQVSIQPIEADDYATSSDFYENSDSFAEYIGDEQEGDDRKEDIRYLADELKDLFTLDEDGETLTYKGEVAMMAFKQAWSDRLQEEAANVTAENVLEWEPRYDVRRTCEETHLRTSYRFYIDGWIDYAGSCDDLIEYVAEEMKEGDKLYIGAVIDYSCY